MRHILFAALVIAAPAAAASTDTITVAAGPSVQVVVADLDLALPGDQRRLDDRLRRAATQVCSFTSLRDLSESRLVDRCRASALARARELRPATMAD